MDDKSKKKEEFKLRIYKYILRLIKFLNKIPQTPVTREIISQLMDSGTSMGANYFESEGASSKKDYLNFFNICLKSANESKFWLALLMDSKLVPKYLEEECKWLLGETKELANIFASSILTMRNKK